MRKRMIKYLYISMGILTLLFGACGRPDSEDIVLPDATTTPVATSSPREVTLSVRPSPTTAPTPTSSLSPTPAPTPTLSPRPTATPEPTKIPSPEKPVVVGEDGILADNELCKVQLVSFGKEECLLVLTNFTTEIKNWNERMLAATAYFENRSEEELSFRIEGTEQVYMRSGRTDEWNEYSPDLWSMDVAAGEKQKLVLYLSAYPENSEESVWMVNFKVKIGNDREDIFGERVEVSVPMEVFED